MKASPCHNCQTSYEACTKKLQSKRNGHPCCDECYEYDTHDAINKQQTTNNAEEQVLEKAKETYAGNAVTPWNNEPHSEQARQEFDKMLDITKKRAVIAHIEEMTNSHWPELNEHLSVLKAQLDQELNPPAREVSAEDMAAAEALENLANEAEAAGGNVTPEHLRGVAKHYRLGVKND